MDKILINKCFVLEVMYRAIKDSMEWGSGCEDNSHTMFIDGIIAMTEILLDEINKLESGCIENEQE